VSFIFVAVLVSCCSRQAGAQVLYGSIVGTVQDESGAAVPNAAVTITDTATTQTRAATTTEEGSYVFADVPAGSYTLAITAKGFRVSRTSNVQVTINAVSRNDVRLQVGELAETVNVEASAAVLQTDTADLHVSLGSRQITELPLPGYRNYQALINLVPGATPANYQNAVSGSPGRSLNTNINGASNTSNNTRLDGAEHARNSPRAEPLCAARRIHSDGQHYDQQLRR